MKDENRERSRSRLLLELLFSLNTALAGVSLIFSANLSASLAFIHLEVYLNHLLGIRQTDYIRGYFTLWIPSLALAICLLGLLRVLTASGITNWMQSVGGILTLLCPTAVWTYGYEQASRWSLQWPYKLIWGEAVLALTCIWIFLVGPWEMARKIGTSAVLGHCIFWYWFINGFHLPSWEMPGYGGEFGMVVGIFTLLTWFCYAYRMREHPPLRF